MHIVGLLLNVRNWSKIFTQITRFIFPEKMWKQMVPIIIMHCNWPKQWYIVY